ncbi:sulfate transport system permease protein CysT [mine drainage metagenome]|uniref:Sulfate transport system permease protein CysT n=1 Tax=mine drainage metagenome TaxID=410659 RepID=A0A1J5QW88_9ZZZZ
MARSTVLPGFPLSLGLSLAFLALVVLLPLAGLFLHAAGLGWAGFFRVAFAPRALAAYGLSFGGALLAALLNAGAGLLVAWVLVRASFPGRRLLDALVDLPFALPTAVAGIALATLYGPHGLLGAPLLRLGLAVAYTRLGVVAAMTFIGLPFVVRTVQPVLQDLGSEPEEAAASLGAGRLQVAVRVVLPLILPALFTGATLAFARALGEYGAVVFIAGNVPGVSEIAPLLIATRVEQFDIAGATAIATVMLTGAFLLLLAVNMAQLWQRRRREGV